MRRSKYIGVALVGLLVVAAITVAAGSGRKPPEPVEVQAAVSLRRISASEVMAILNKFPEKVPDFLALKKNDTGSLTDVFQFNEVTATRLEHMFPAARFYEGFYITLPPIPYLMAVVGDRCYMMPAEFNRLLLDNGLQMTDKNIVELAKTFVVLAVGNQGHGLFPQITFLDAKRIEEYDRRSQSATDVEIRCRIDNGEVQSWKFSQSRRSPRRGEWVRFGQFATVRLAIGGRPVYEYRVEAVEETRRGESYTVPQVEIVIDSGNATVESDGMYDHYYLETYRDGSPTNCWVRFRLYDFDSCEAYVYVRVYPEYPYTYGPDTLLGPIEINGSGEGSLDWTPSSGTKTGMGVVCAGNKPPGDTFFSQRTRVLDNQELTLEKVITGQFPGGGSQMLKVSFCHQFFEYHDSLEGHAPVFAQYVEDAMLESCSTQVVAWGLGTPPDADDTQQVFINDGFDWYHGPALQASYARQGDNRRIGVPSSIWAIFHEYTTEGLILRSAIAHEFYHGIQWVSPDKWVRSWWRWFSEAQAVFIQSVQLENEEFKQTGGLRQYAVNADILLANHLNTSLVALSNDTLLDLRGYPYCLFWRFMYEKFGGRDSGGIQLVKNCYAENVGTNNSIGRGKAAIDAAIQKWHGGAILPGFPDFLHALDQFAVACYLNDTSFHLWNPNPPGVYSRPHLTLDTAFRLGPNETDSIKVIDGIPHSFGIDLMQVALNRAAASGMLRRTLDRQGLEVIIGGNQGSSDGCNDYKEDRSIQGGAYA